MYHQLNFIESDHEKWRKIIKKYYGLEKKIEYWVEKVLTYLQSLHSIQVSYEKKFVYQSLPASQTEIKDFIQIANVSYISRKFFCCLRNLKEF